jgi:hypothetical protein
MGTRRQKPKDVIKARAEPLPAWMPVEEEEEQEETPPVIGRPRGATQLQILWDKAIVALLLIPDVGEAARSIGVSKGTLYGWLRDREFLRQLTEIRREGAAQVIRASYGQMGKAVQTLADILNDPKTNAVARISAAKILIELGTKWIDQEREQEIANERLREMQRLNEELKAQLNGQNDCIEPLALGAGSGDGNNGGTAEGAGEGERGPSGAGESTADVGV